MSVPRVVIVGRPNVGKSTLLNRICARRRVSIVEPTAGVTRDRVSVLRRDLDTAWQPRHDRADRHRWRIGDRRSRRSRAEHVEEQIRAALCWSPTWCCSSSTCPRGQSVPSGPRRGRSIARIREARLALGLQQSREGRSSSGTSISSTRSGSVRIACCPISAQNGTGLAEFH